MARGDSPETADALAAGPDGAWAIVVGGEKPRLIRYDAALKNIGETPLLYTSALTYDAARNRYLAGGGRYSAAEPSGRQVILSVDAANGKLLGEVRWPGIYSPSVFVPWGPDALVAFAMPAPALVSVLDASTLALRSQIATGVHAEFAVVDDRAQRLYVADDLGRVHVLGLPAGEEIAVWEGRSPIALDAANGRLYVNRAEGVVALDAATGSVVALPPAGLPCARPERQPGLSGGPGNYDLRPHRREARHAAVHLPRRTGLLDEPLRLRSAG